MHEATADTKERDSQCRWLLLAAAGGLCGGLPVTRALAASSPVTVDPRLLELLRDKRTLWLLRGNEELRATYWTAERGRNQDEYLNLCWFLRDIQGNRVFAMDRSLLFILAGSQTWLLHSGVDAPIEIHSGYRTRRTNNKTEGAELSSRHVVGQAAEISVAGRVERQARPMLSVLGRGGTGIYVGRGYVRVDTGNERIWIDQKRKSAGT